MEKRLLRWKLCEDKETKEFRYCHNCGKKVMFKDSGKRRFNANGKDIYEYAIYKCERGHTWNYRLGNYKPGEIDVGQVACNEESVTSVERINLSLFREEGVMEVEILLQEVAGKWRLDKLLAHQIEDLSRTHIEKIITSGKVSVDNQCVRPNMFLRKGQTIKIFL